MDTNQDDLNEDFKKENIEITGSSKINVDDEIVVPGEIGLTPDEKLIISDNLNDDELDSDKMDFEPEEKDYM